MTDYYTCRDCHGYIFTCGCRERKEPVIAVMQNELKPCPFCGGEAGKVFFLKGHTPASIGDTQHSETCPLAFSWSGFYRPTPEEAIAAWNTRASDAENTRLTEALRAAEEREKALRGRFQIGERVRIIAPEWEGEPPHYITGIDWHPKHDVTYTTSEVWPPKVSGFHVQGLTDQWRQEDLARAELERQQP